jgi:hypothetical protein
MLEVPDSLVGPFTLASGLRKTVVSDLSDTLVVHFAEDLTAAVSASDQILWSCRASRRYRHRFIMMRRWTLRSGALMAGHQNPPTGGVSGCVQGGYST